MVELKDLFKAYYLCRKHKRGTLNAKSYEVDYEANLVRLHRAIMDRTYYPTRSIAFVVSKPKYREVFAADFSDRVVHHYIAMRLEPLMEEVFTDRTFNCRKGKGTLYGVNMLKSDIFACSEGYTKDCWVAKADISGFFMSIDRQLLGEMVDRFIVENYHEEDKEEVRWLCDIVIHHEPQNNCIKQSSEEMWKHIAKNKSLFTVEKGRGLPIGNLSSQLFANFFMSVFDWYVINKLGFPFYGRYVDDFYIVDKDKNKILEAMPKIREFLKVHNHLQLHPNKFYIQHYKKGIAFTGGIMKPGRAYVSNRTVTNFMYAVKRLSEAKNVKKIMRQVQSVNSYLGLMQHYNSYAIRRKVLKRLAGSKCMTYCYVRKSDYGAICVKKPYRVNRILRLKLGLERQKRKSNWDKYHLFNDIEDRPLDVFRFGMGRKYARKWRWIHKFNGQLMGYRKYVAIRLGMILRQIPHKQVLYHFEKINPRIKHTQRPRKGYKQDKGPIMWKVVIDKWT